MSQGLSDVTPTLSPDINTHTCCLCLCFLTHPVLTAKTYCYLTLWKRDLLKNVIVMHSLKCIRILQKHMKTNYFSITIALFFITVYNTSVREQLTRTSNATKSGSFFCSVTAQLCSKQCSFFSNKLLFPTSSSVMLQNAFCIHKLIQELRQLSY